MKHIVFFSHSSLDKDRIKPIKDLILEKTGNAFDIFMSSDGASIPHGTNWLYQIESALENCKIMFVWATPNSIRSNWIFFETGYSYAKDVKVIPIGFDGINLEQLPAPLNILQGFNINSSAGLNNIIATINRELNFTYPDIFDDTFYNEKVIKFSSENSSELLEYVKSVKCEYHPIITRSNSEKIKIDKNWSQRFQENVNSKDEQCMCENGSIHGIGYKMSTRRFNDLNYPLVIIDPLSVNRILSLLIAFNRIAYNEKMERFFLSIRLNPNYVLPEDSYLISSRLQNTEVDFDSEAPNLIFNYRNISFRINCEEAPRIPSELVLLIDNNFTEEIPLLSLMKLLIDRNIIKKTTSK